MQALLENMAAYNFVDIMAHFDVLSVYIFPLSSISFFIFTKKKFLHEIYDVYMCIALWVIFSGLFINLYA